MEPVVPPLPIWKVSDEIFKYREPLKSVLSWKLPLVVRVGMLRFTLRLKVPLIMTGVPLELVQVWFTGMVSIFGKMMLVLITNPAAPDSTEIPLRNVREPGPLIVTNGVPDLTVRRETMKSWPREVVRLTGAGDDGPKPTLVVGPGNCKVLLPLVAAVLKLD